MGLHLTAWGLLITFGGFTITLYQLAETRTSFEAAKVAVDKWKRQRANVQLIDNIHDSMQLLRRGLDDVGVNWGDFKRSYDQVLILVASMLASRRELVQPEIDYLQSVQTHITDVCSELDDQIANGNVNFVIAELSAKLRELQIFFVGLEQSIKDRIDE